MKLQQNQKKKIKISMYLVYLVLILLPLLVTATYTWFSLSRTPKVSEMSISIDSGVGMELSFQYDTEEWSQHLDFSEMLADCAPLRPVTWSEADQCFYAAEYGVDGRISHISQKLSDEYNANRDDAYGYYMKNTFYARTGEPVEVSLSPAVVGADGTQGAGTYLIGKPIWNEETIEHDNGGDGAEYAVRVGIRITKLNIDGIPKEDEDSIFYIYEPNYDGHPLGHADAVKAYRKQQEEKALEGEGSTAEETESTSEETQSAENTDDRTANLYMDTPSIDGTDILVPEERLIRQTLSIWNEKDPVEKGVVVQYLGEFLDDTKLFDLETEEYAQIDLYIWLEGQDIDCDNRIGQEAEIFANIQFYAEAPEQGGMDTIE